MSKELLFLTPVCTHNIWGGTRLREEFGYPVAGDDIGECWGISAHPNGDGTIADGTYKGRRLSTVWQEHPELFGETGLDRFPLLTKIIDAKADLSIQVHPNDAYAKEHENGSLGKTECWFIVDCPEDATLVVGHNARTREELEEMIHAGKWNAFIREIPIKPGDFIQIDPGTVHAIKGGVLLLETQQNSDITYRVYDYDRLSNGKPRQLHVAQSIDVITVPAKSAEDSVVHTGKLPDTVQKLIECAYYKVYRIDVEKCVTWAPEGAFQLLSVLEGEGSLNGTPLRKGDHLIVPNGYGEICLEGKLQLIASQP